MLERVVTLFSAAAMSAVMGCGGASAGSTDDLEDEPEDESGLPACGDSDPVDYSSYLHVAPYLMPPRSVFMGRGEVLSRDEVSLVIAPEDSEDYPELRVLGDPMPPLAEPGEVLEVKVASFAEESAQVELRREDQSVLWVSFDGEYYPEVVAELDLAIVLDLTPLCEAMDSIGCHEFTSVLDVLVTAGEEQRRVPVGSQAELQVEGTDQVLNAYFAREFGEITCNGFDLYQPGMVVSVQALAKELVE